MVFGEHCAPVRSDDAEPEFKLTTFFSLARLAMARPTPELARSTNTSTFSTSIHCLPILGPTWGLFGGRAEIRPISQPLASRRKPSTAICAATADPGPPI